MGKHSLDHTPDGLVTAFRGELDGEMPTRILPIVDLTATETLPAAMDTTETLSATVDSDTDRFYVGWFDAANALVGPSVIEPSHADRERAAAATAVRATARPTLALLRRIERGLRNL